MGSTGGRLRRSTTRSTCWIPTASCDCWARLETPRPEVYSVLEYPPGERLYAGTHPAHCYVSTDAGVTWSECRGLQALSSRESWHTPRHRNEAHLRALRAAGGRLVAGIEVGGVYVSDDGGETWTERSDGLYDDVHHLLVADSTWVASTGDGLYRTDDDGRAWTRLDGDIDHRYFREARLQDGRLYAVATAGTTAGRLLRRTGGEWLGAGSVSSGIVSLAAVG